MAESEQDRIFRTKVLPIMDNVRERLQRNQADEFRKHSFSFGSLMAGAIGPDGGMAATQSYNDSLRYTGKWSSKTTEDYIEMVKKELKLVGVTVDAAMEKRMIDKMIQDKIPRSSIDYIMKKAATSTLFYLPQEVAKSPLEKSMDAEAERRYNPSTWEKNTGRAIGSVADLLCMGGFGGGWKTAATWVGGDLALSHFTDKYEDRSDVPLIVRPGMEEEYRKAQKVVKQQEQSEQREHNPCSHGLCRVEREEGDSQQKEEKQSTPSESDEATEQETPTETPASSDETPTEQLAGTPEQTNMDGWQGLLTSFGLNGISDITHNLGYVLAMLPDMLVGLFTGKTKSINLKDNMMPIVSIVAGMFVRNPILKMVLIGMGGLNLLNKAGHEAIDNYKVLPHPETGNARTHYRVYPDEPLNGRIVNPEIRSNCLVATIDRVPCTIALPDRVVDAYTQGALPLNTLANAVLARHDQMRQMASDNYEANERQTIVRPLAQR